jgi:hypothetical protein
VRALGRRADFFDDWIDHPEVDDYWAAINRTDARGTPVPSLHVAGLYDIFCGPQLCDFAAAGPQGGLDLGPFAHGTYAIAARKLGWRQAGLFPGQLRSWLDYLDHRLQGRPLARERVRRYLIGEDRWLDEPAYPPPGARDERFYPRSERRLLREAPGGDEPPDRYTYDPAAPVPTRGGTFLGPRCDPADHRSLAGRADVLCYDTPPLERELELAGPVRLRLRASSDAPATDFTGKLVWLPADGGRPALNLCEGVRRVARVESDAMEVDLDLWHASARIPRGGRLRLEVSSSNFPRYDAHPNVAGHPGHAREQRPARQTVHHSADAPSWLELTVRDG